MDNLYSLGLVLRVSSTSKPGKSDLWD